jgi:hypothetical protein
LAVFRLTSRANFPVETRFIRPKAPVAMAISIC